jgi:pyruvate dehydrogenase E1 component beta subunit
MAKLNLVGAVNLALHEAMESDENVVVMGEDVGVNGGVFRATEGLYERFGKTRVIDTPLAESGIVGTAIGMAVYGLHPVAEIQFDGFTFPAFNQIFSHAARIRNRSRGRYLCPLVIRAPYGGGVKAPEHHSEPIESFYIHIPGLKVVLPSTPYDAKGLLTSAIRDPDPVIFFEPKRLYRAYKKEVPEGEYTIPLGSAKLVREGENITLISWGASMKETREAAEELKDTYSCEVIDLCCLSPLDYDTVLDSVRKTGRCVIIHEAPRTLGFASEIIARINEKAFYHLEAPIKRVSGYDIPVPLPKLEDYYLPSTKRIILAVEETMRVDA